MIVSGISLGFGRRRLCGACFSAGVFEAFMQKELIFPHIVGVSAGACNIVSYMSQQPLRTRRVIQNYVGDKRYCSLSNWLRTRSLFGFDFILKELPQNLLPFDYEAFRKYPGQLYVARPMLSQASLSGIPRAIWIKIFCRCAHPLHCPFLLLSSPSAAINY